MTTSPDLFFSPKLSIDRAKFHINSVKDRIESLNKEESPIYRIVKEAYGNKQQFIVKAVLCREIPEDIISSIIDAIYNLRASVDQSLFTVVKLLKDNGNTGINLNKIKFPVNKEQRSFEEAIKKLSGLNGMPNGIIEGIRNQEPFSKDAKSSPILALNTLANINKHRNIVRYDIRSNKFSLKHLNGPKTVGGLEYFELGGGGHDVKTVPSEAPVKRSEIGLYVSRFNPPTKYEVVITVDVKFDAINELGNQSCLFLLQEMLNSCEQLYNCFYQTCNDAGLIDN